MSVQQEPVQVIDTRRQGTALLCGAIVLTIAWGITLLGRSSRTGMFFVIVLPLWVALTGFMGYSYYRDERLEFYKKYLVAGRGDARREFRYSELVLGEREMRRKGLLKSPRFRISTKSSIKIGWDVNAFVKLRRDSVFLYDWLREKIPETHA